MNQSDSGWRKRQIALEKMAENARELGLDYEPSIIEMAREADKPDETCWLAYEIDFLERFAALVRADERNRTWTQDRWTEYEHSIAAAEREACAKVCEDSVEYAGDTLAAAIRARGQA